MSQSESTKYIKLSIKVLEEVDFWEKRDQLRQLLNNALIESLRTKERDIDKDKIEIIKQYISNKLKIPTKYYLEKCRNEQVVEMRHLAIYFTREILNYKLSDISHYFSLSNHTTGLHAIKKIKNRVNNYKEYRKKIDLMEEELIELL